MAIHTLTAGRIGAMILDVMSGVTLADTGRDLTAKRASVVIFVLIDAAAIVWNAAFWNMSDVMILLACRPGAGWWRLDGPRSCTARCC